MSEPVKTPFDLLLDQIRAVVREEIQAVSNGTGKPAKLLFTTKEAAAMLGVEESWLAAKARTGKIPHRMLGHYRFFSIDDIDVIIKDSADKAKEQIDKRCKEGGRGRKKKSGPKKEPKAADQGSSV